MALWVLASFVLVIIRKSVDIFAHILQSQAVKIPQQAIVSQNREPTIKSEVCPLGTLVFDRPLK
jgi:hypothetical protein